MPLNKTAGNRGWKYGTKGKTFTGKDAKRKALMDGLKKVAERVDTENIDINIDITKHDVERQQIFGWANVSMANGELVVDSHGDTISLEELENAAYAFNLNFHNASVGEMHKGEAKGRLIESFVVTPEKLEKLGLDKNALPHGWWVGMYLEDKDLFEKVKSGEYRAMSIQGMAQRVKGE